jgi:DNA mismatch repair protein MSH2
MVDAPIIMSAISQISEGVRTIGIAYVDVTSRRLGATQFDDDDQLCALERVLVQLGAKECVLPQVGLPVLPARSSSTQEARWSTLWFVQDTSSSETENAKLEQVFSECDVLVSRRPRAQFTKKDLEGAFEVLLKGKNILQHEHILERSLACAALGAVLKFAELTADPDNHGTPFWHKLCTTW